MKVKEDDYYEFPGAGKRVHSDIRLVCCKCGEIFSIYEERRASWGSDHPADTAGAYHDGRPFFDLREGER
nr:hypothetical protein [Candidatus Njordarchaeota archaeon]